MKIILLLLSLQSFSESIYDSIPETRRFNEVTWLASHNSFAMQRNPKNPKSVGYTNGNQKASIKEQLEKYHVRALFLDIFLVADEEKDDKFIKAFKQSMPKRKPVDRVAMCLLDCELTTYVLLPFNKENRQTLEKALQTVVKFLDDNPKEIVTIFLEDKIGPYATLSPEDTQILNTTKDPTKMNKPGRHLLDHILEITGANKYKIKSEIIKTYSGTTRWPTLKEMRDTNKRLIIFTDMNGNGAPFISYDQMVVFNTYDLGRSDGKGRNCSPWDKNKKELGADAFTLLTLYHSFNFSFDIETGHALGDTAQNNIRFINHGILHNKGLRQYIEGPCMTQWKRLPNFIAIDHVDRVTQGGASYTQFFKDWNKKPIDDWYSGCDQHNGPAVPEGKCKK